MTDEGSNYCINVRELVTKCGSKDLAIRELVSLVRSGKIKFPYHRYHCLDPDVLFKNLQQLQLEILTKAYRLYSYYPLYGTYMPPKFRGAPLVIGATSGTYNSADVLSDYFIEDVRMQARRFNQKLSIAESWNDDTTLFEIMSTAMENSEKITPQYLRHVIYQTIPETKIFYPTWARCLITTVLGTKVHGKKWLDVSAGWGDRLLTAMSLGMDYTGFDPNVNLKPGHSAMIAKFGHPNHHQVIYQPFERARIPGMYDVIMTSPPYFTVEEYVPGQKGQSIVSYPNFDDWMVNFMFAALVNAWIHLKFGGYLILHLGDSHRVRTCEAVNIFIENHLPRASWEGVIGLQTYRPNLDNYPRPVWVWLKAPDNVPVRKWEPLQTKYTKDGRRPIASDRRTLDQTYPQLYRKYLRSRKS